jgi:hypothetical protein
MANNSRDTVRAQDVRVRRKSYESNRAPLAVSGFKKIRRADGLTMLMIVLLRSWSRVINLLIEMEHWSLEIARLASRHP